MIDFIKNLNKELGIFLISIAIASVIILFSYGWFQSSLENRNNAHSTLKQATSRYYTAINRKQILEEYEGKYNKLLARGVAGEENRLHWIDVIENATSKHKIPYLKYHINKQQKLTSSSLTTAFPGIDIFRSSMELHMQLLHEGDLFSVLNTIDTNARGLFDIQSCSIANNNLQIDSLLESETNLNFASVCTLNWYTVKKRSIVIPDPRRRS